MGNSESNVDDWDKRIKIINNPDFYDLLQQPLSEQEREKFSKKKFPTQ